MKFSKCANVLILIISDYITVHEWVQYQRQVFPYKKAKRRFLILLLTFGMAYLQPS